MKSLDPKTALKDEERRLKLRKSRIGLAANYRCRREYYDAISEHRHLFTMLLRVAELRHRYKLGDAQPFLIEAVDLGTRLAVLWKDGNKFSDSICPTGNLYTSGGERWETLPKTIDAINFRFGTAALIALSVHDHVPAIFFDVVPRIEKWSSIHAISPLNYPDVGLLELISNNKKPSWWGGMLNFIRKFYNGRRLLPDTMECYAEIVLACHAQDWNRAVGAVRHAEDLYLLRGKDTFDEFEPWEGTGAGNALSIDLRLSALIKHCFRLSPSTLDALDSIHKLDLWRA